MIIILRRESERVRKKRERERVTYDLVYLFTEISK